MPDAVFYSHFKGDPFFNMAFDEHLLARSLELPGCLFLRLYSWSPGTITFGNNQRESTALDWDRIGETPVIRRVTGGRAIFHDEGEITYSIVVNGLGQESPLLSGSVSTVSANLADALARFLESLGIQSAYARQSAPENAQPAFFHKAPCFASHARYELMTGGRKIIASAQKRLSDSILQHGSIKLQGLARHPALDGDVDRIADLGQALTEERFRQLAAQFRLVMGVSLGVEFVDAGDRTTADDGLQMRLTEVRANSIARREILKQSAPASSL